MGRFFIGITGASGHAYSTALVRELVRAGHDVDLSVTNAGAKVMAHELGIDPGPGGEGLADCLGEWLGEEIASSVRAFPSAAVESPAASGTALTQAVILVPCSMGTLARVTHGFSSNLVERAADVALKEGRPLLVMPRETPLSEVHLANMLQLARMGASILPCTPGFYQHPKTLEDLVRFVVARALDRLGVEHGLGARWGESEPEEEMGIEPPGGSP